MKGLVFRGPGIRAWEDRPKPTIMEATDAIVRITTTTICGTDLHILKGDVPTVTNGRILGHEGVGIIESLGTNVLSLHIGDKVLISCITSCGRCSFCRKGMYSHCRIGGWVLGNRIDGIQAEYVRIPCADTSLYALSPETDVVAAAMVSDILPTGLECGVLNGQVKPGDIVAIVGAGPVGLAALLTAQLYSPAEVVMIDLDDHRLEVARSLGATKVVNSSDGKADEHIMALTNDDGVDVAIEAVGIPATFDICQSIVTPGGRIANVGVHGKPVELHLERLWSHNVSLTTRLVDTVTTPMLLRIVQSGRLDVNKLVSHEFDLSEIMQAYDTFESAAKERAKGCAQERERERRRFEGESMSHQARVSHPIYNLLPAEIEGFDSLAELALDMNWSWNHATDEVWRKLDPDLWAFTHNPWVVLQTVSRDRIERVLGDPVFRKSVDGLVEARRQATETLAWFQRTHPEAPLTCIAYFSMEFMLSEALPIYSGGLGNVAGDQLKAASDLGVPVVGVGLLYQQGYFRQVIGKNGEQEALFPYNDPGQLPITPLRHPNGEWLRLEIALPGYSVWLRAWQVQVGRVKLYLLDSNDAANFPAHRGITSELYGGGPELRLKQDLLLGIGGWRLLRALGIRPEVCHLNEGHAAFAILERARNFMEDTGQPFEVALAVTRAGNLFTTHTAVAAGFDRFAPALIEQYLSGYAKQKLGVSLRDLLAFGRQNPDDSSEHFNMAYLAIRGCGAANGVSRLHGEVSRRLFLPLFPRWPEVEIPIGHVTNGVHMPTWDSAPADGLWTEACGKDRWLGTTETLVRDIRRVSDAKLWQFRIAASKSLVEYARKRLSLDLSATGALPEEVEVARHLFDPNALTLGFARRFATYKRPNLLLNDPQRLLRLLTNSQRPVQLIIAGKAHPADQAGQALIQEWTQFIRQPEARPHAIFLGDYDMLLTEHLVQGVDVWINTPRRPWEASGTSGMKVLVNGGLNLSELDGWWAEAYAPELGWALGDGQEHGEDPDWDAAEADALYGLLEREVIPEFYARDERGIPAAWMARMRNSMASLTPRFSADRAVREYTEQHYLPGAVAYRERAAGKGAVGRQIADWQRTTDQGWPAVHFGEMKVETDGEQHVFEVRVYLSDLDPDAVRVELYADGANGSDPVRQEMTRIRQLAGAASGCVYGARVPAVRPPTDYTARVIPHHTAVAVPLEATQILWQR